MNRLTFSRMLVATGLLTLSLALVSSWQAVVWISYASVVEAGPSPLASIAVLAFTIAVSLATLGWGVRGMRLGSDEQAMNFSHVLVLAGILGLGVVGSLSIWTVYLISVFEWAEGFRLQPPPPSDLRVDVVVRGLLRLPHSSDLLSRATSYSTAFDVQLVAFALPLAIILEGFRRMLLARRNPGPPVEGLGPARLVVVLALFGLMVACAAAPMPVYVITRTGGVFLSTVVGEMVTLAVSFSVPIGTLFLVAVTHRKRGLRASTWFPVVIALFVVAIAAGTATDQYGVPAVVVGIPLAALLWAAIVVGRSRSTPLSVGQMLGVVALIGLIIVAGATRGAVNSIEVGRLYGLPHTWPIVLVAIAYAINLGIFAAAVWRLRVESRQEPVPEPESA